jgi:hypothetical protein
MRHTQQLWVGQEKSILVDNKPMMEIFKALMDFRFDMALKSANRKLVANRNCSAHE